jgi:NAD+ kinase
MRRIATIVRAGAFEGDLGACLRTLGLVLDEQSPEVVLCMGGDGTLLEAERRFPGVPKVPLRFSQIGKKCESLELHRALALLRSDMFEPEIHAKLEARAHGRSLVALNDITIRNSFPGHALRFRIALGGRCLEREFIGDGIVVATPFGADAYFYSVSRSRFDRGFGLAFNNVTEPMEPLYFGDEIDVRLQIVRGRATIGSDNDPNISYGDQGDIIRIARSRETAVVLRMHARQQSRPQLLSHVPA